MPYYQLSRLIFKPKEDNQIQNRTYDPMQQHASQIIPYPPSFIDRFMDFVKRLPIPYWLTYLVLFILESILVHVVAWIDGWLPAYTFSPLPLIFPLWLWTPLAMMTFLDRVSLEALSSFRPLLDVDEEQLNKLKYEFTVMPARGVIFSGVFWVTVYILLTVLAYQAFYVGYGLGTTLSVVIFVAGLISFAIGSAIYYHSFRQLRLVNRTVKMVQHFNLFQLDPVYAFSRVTSLIGVSWMIMLSLTLLTFPIDLLSAPVLAILVLQVGLAVAAFVLPLWFVHVRLLTEKRRLLGEINRRVEATIENLHHSIDGNELSVMDPLNKAVMSLNVERDMVNNIPTWPWRAGTLTGFLSALFLPIILFLIQLAIQKWFGG